MSTQAEWVTYAENIDGLWDLCANCGRDGTGKKLFRQYNINRYLISQPTENSPIDNTESCTQVNIGSAFVSYSPDNEIYGIIQSTPGDQDFYVVAQLGMALKNPVCLVRVADQGVQQFSGPIFDWCEAVANFFGGLKPPPQFESLTLYTCAFLPTGAPGYRNLYDFQIISQ
jgi:hypothetical protein